MSYYGPSGGGGGGSRWGENSSRHHNNHSSSWQHYTDRSDDRRSRRNDYAQSPVYKRSRFDDERGELAASSGGDGRGQGGGYHPRNYNNQRQGENYPHKGISKEEFHALSREEQILAMYPDINERDNIKEVKDRLGEALMCIQVDRVGWKEKKEEAAKKAADIMISEIPTQTISDPYESDESGVEEDDDNDVDIIYSPDTIRSFAEALQYNYLLDTTFHDSGILTNNKFCFCPCGKKMKKWREIFKVTSLSQCDECDSSSTTKPMSPNAFMDHLAKVSENKNAVFHQLVEIYLRKLWGDHWSEGIGHKALYKPGDRDYKNSERAQMKFHQASIIERDQKIEKLEREKEAKDKKIQEYEELKKVNKNLYDKLEQSREDYDALGVKFELFKRKEVPTDASIVRCSRQLKKFFSVVQKNHLVGKGLFKSADSIDELSEKATVLNIQSTDSSLQSIFDEWYTRDHDKKTKHDDKTFLFVNLDAVGKKKCSDHYRMFFDWNVRFHDPTVDVSKIDSLGSISNKKKRREKEAAEWAKMGLPVDEGGPTAQFMSLFCSQIDSLAVYVDIKQDYYCDPKITSTLLRKGTEVWYGGKKAVMNRSQRVSKPGVSVSDAQCEIQFEKPEEINNPENKPFMVRRGEIQVKQYYEIQEGSYVEWQRPSERVKAKVIRKGQGNNMWKIQYVDQRDGTNDHEVARKDIVLRKVRFDLFESDGAIVPRKGGSKIDDEGFGTKYKYISKNFEPTMGWDKVREKIESFYEAIGRILLKIMMNDRNTIASRVLPRFYRNILLRDFSPEMEEYRMEDLLPDLKEIGIDKVQDILDSLKCKDEECKETNESLISQANESFRTKYVAENYVNHRKLALDALKRGLTLNGLVDVSIPLHAHDQSIVSEVVFSKPYFDVEDILEILEPKYSLEVEGADGNIVISAELVNQQKKFFSEFIPTFFREKSSKDPDFVQTFVQVVTGSLFLPSRVSNPDFKIKVEFNLEGVGSTYMQVWTCENTIQVPACLILGGTDEQFKEGLDYLLKSCDKFSDN